MDTSQIITIVVSLVGVLTVGVLVPIGLLARTEKVRREDLVNAAQQHREDRAAEWARQDEVAARAEQARRDLAAVQEATANRAAEAAAALMAAQKESIDAQKEVARQAAVAADLLVENNKLVAETARETGRKLDTIHTLVNSNMTAAMQAEHDAVKRELAMMREVMELRRAGGQEPGDDTIAAIGATEAKLRDLAAALAERATAQAKVTRSGLDVITTTHYRERKAGDAGDDQ